MTAGPSSPADCLPRFTSHPLLPSQRVSEEHGPILLFYLAVELTVGTLGLWCSAASGKSSKLGDDVWQELILDAGDLILEEQLLFLQPLELKLVGTARFLQRVDGAIELAVLLLEREQRRPELANLHALHGRHSSLLCLEGTGKVSR